MSNQKTAISWTEIIEFISPSGQAALVELVRTAKEERGKGWLESLKAEYPMFCWIADLVCNHDAETAFKELQSEFNNYPLWLFKSQLFALHGKLKFEIERKR